MQRLFLSETWHSWDGLDTSEFTRDRPNIALEELCLKRCVSNFLESFGRRLPILSPLKYELSSGTDTVA